MIKMTQQNRHNNQPPQQHTTINKTNNWDLPSLSLASGKTLNWNGGERQTTHSSCCRRTSKDTQLAYRLASIHFA